MSDEIAFLASLRADPSDATARLVYADWLDERGDAVRAEFLRLAVQSKVGADVDEEERARHLRLRPLAVGLDPAWLAAALGLRVGSVEVGRGLAFTAGATVTFADSLEVSLDCCVCRRCHRTVVFQGDCTNGRCTPTNHLFPGYLLRKDEPVGSSASVRFLVAYRYEPFVDAKYTSRQPRGVTTWARVYFSVVCPACGESVRDSTQTNLVRPWTCRCRCGAVVYEDREMPMLNWWDCRAA
jgi:uncharacterized protein (TIGR02996 family)